MAKLIKEVLDEYGITRIGGIMADNAGDNGTLVEALAEDFELDAKASRFRCLGHIINLVMKALLFGNGLSKLEKELASACDEDAFEIWHKEGPIAKLHNIMVCILRSADRVRDFKDCQLDIDEAITITYAPIADSGIRWHSTAAMIERAMKLRDAIDLFQS